ncbi:MAG: integral rane protein [Ilumatobacteraceae bacterium]|nr:integral rane protein [Ilumatobacteraceae bacterium]
MDHVLASPARGGPDRGPWAGELIGVVRAVAGGLLFGVPLLFTMEVWWTGTRTSPTQMVAVLSLLFIPLLVLNRTEGFRGQRDVRLVDAAADSIEAMAIGIVVAAVVLVLLRELTLDTPVGVWLGKVLYEAVPFCLGIGVARHFLHGGRTGDDDDGDGDGAGRQRIQSGYSEDLADLGATTIGAAFIALAIAPTDEIPMISATMTPAWLLVMVAATLLFSYAIVFVAGFAGQEGRRRQQGPFQHPLTETLVCYLVALAVSLFLLWMFQRGQLPAEDLLTRIIVLGLPASVGGAAGRLAL